MFSFSETNNVRTSVVVIPFRIFMSKNFIASGGGKWTNRTFDFAKKSGVVSNHSLARWVFCGRNSNLLESNWLSWKLRLNTSHHNGLNSWNVIVEAIKEARISFQSHEH